MKLTLARIAEFVSAEGEFPPEEVAQGYSIDSRTVGPGQLFFAVKGERLDGHDFVEQALKNGAVAAVVSKDQLGRYPVKARLLAVDDTLAALQTLATAVRKLWGKPLIGVTGSAGKTTTKEAIAHVLSARFRVLKSEGNFNNHFGLPLMLLKLEPEYDVAVIEMGMSHAGEIRALAKIARPEIGVVTNVAPVHLEFFDSLAGIARAKYELIEGLPSNGTAVLNADDEYVSQFGRDFKGKVVMYGMRATADVRGEKIRSKGTEGAEFDVAIGSVREHATLPLVGEHNVQNALAAVAVGFEMEIDDQTLRSAFAGFRGVKRRFTKTGDVGGITIIDDYGHHPVEIAAVLKAARQAGARDVIAIVQPHRYSRLASLFTEFCTCMNDAGTVIVADVYAAGEPPIARISRDSLVDGLRASGHRSVVPLESPDHLAEMVHAIAKPGDFVVCLGAGNITAWAHALPAQLAALQTTQDPRRRAGGAT